MRKGVKFWLKQYKTITFLYVKWKIIRQYI